MKKAIKISLFIPAFLLVIVLAYLLYVFISYDRIEDFQSIKTTSADTGKEFLKRNASYTIFTYNIGFGAYTPDFSFFMDGGSESVAASKDSVISTISGAAALMAAENADFYLFQEVDLNSTRSYHVDESEIITAALPDYNRNFAVNYDSAFLFYPLLEPHGKSLAGISTYSKFPVTEAIRRSLPVSTGFSKFLDLDRCYSVSKIPVEDGKFLCLYNIHMSAYGNDDAVRAGQVAMICEDMKAEYEAGNYIICGGDFNHDLKNMGENTHSVHSWAYPFPREALPEGISFAMDRLSPEEREALNDTSRNADMAYEEGKTYTVTLDGFLISDNIQCTLYRTRNTGYLYSDHEPVQMEFQLTGKEQAAPVSPSFPLSATPAHCIPKRHDQKFRYRICQPYTGHFPYFRKQERHRKHQNQPPENRENVCRQRFLHGSEISCQNGIVSHENRRCKIQFESGYRNLLKDRIPFNVKSQCDRLCKNEDQKIHDAGYCQHRYHPIPQYSENLFSVSLSVKTADQWLDSLGDSGIYRHNHKG